MNGPLFMKLRIIYDADKGDIEYQKEVTESKIQPVEDAGFSPLVIVLILAVLILIYGIFAFGQEFFN